MYVDGAHSSRNTQVSSVHQQQQTSVTMAMQNYTQLGQSMITQRQPLQQQQQQHPLSSTNMPLSPVSQRTMTMEQYSARATGILLSLSPFVVFDAIHMIVFRVQIINMSMFSPGGSTMWAGSNTATYTGQMGNNNFCKWTNKKALLHFHLILIFKFLLYFFVIFLEIDCLLFLQGAIVQCSMKSTCHRFQICLVRTKEHYGWLSGLSSLCGRCEI